MQLSLIQKRIFEIRNCRVMLDRDLAALYGVETRVLMQAVKRNMERFPPDFMFQINRREHNRLMSQIVISKRGGTRKLPHVFTEHGVAMLSSVLRSRRAVQMNVSIIRAFIMMRHLSVQHKDLLKKIRELELKYDKNFAEIYRALSVLLGPANNERKRVGYKHYD